MCKVDASVTTNDSSHPTCNTYCTSNNDNATTGNSDCATGVCTTPAAAVVGTCAACTAVADCGATYDGHCNSSGFCAMDCTTAN